MARSRKASASGRAAHQRVRSAKGRSTSSTRWLERQLNDPYVREARAQGYRSRAAFKLLQLDEKFHLLRKGARVLDLGAAPGGWTQVAVERTRPGGIVVGVDFAVIESVPGAVLLECDIYAEDAPARIAAALGGPADLVLSDMAAKASGHAATDHLRIVALCEAAFDIAHTNLAPGGAFVAKVLKGGTERELLILLKRHFRNVRHAKPPASRADSAETYVVATGYRGDGLARTA